LHDRTRKQETNHIGQRLRSEGIPSTTIFSSRIDSTGSTRIQTTVKNNTGITRQRSDSCLLTMSLGFWINQLVVVVLVGTLTFIVWFSTFELTKLTIKHWDYLKVANTLAILAELASNPAVLLLQSYATLTNIMKLIFVVTLVFVYFVVQLDAFIRSPYPRYARARRNRHIHANSQREPNHDFLHDDIIWMLRPPENTPRWKRFGLRFGSNIIRLEAMMLRRDPPFCLCPKGGQAVIHAVYNGKRDSNIVVR
jgi:hypothetical protein